MTGVQTCALPIWTGSDVLSDLLGELFVEIVNSWQREFEHHVESIGEGIEVFSYLVAQDSFSR